MRIYLLKEESCGNALDLFINYENLFGKAQVLFKNLFKHEECCLNMSDICSEMEKTYSEMQKFVHKCELFDGKLTDVFFGNGGGLFRNIDILWNFGRFFVRK